MFKENDIVLYKNKIGIVQFSVHESIDEQVYHMTCSGCEYERRCHNDDTFLCDEYLELLETNDFEDKNFYYVWFDKNNIRRIPEDELVLIENRNQFTILQRHENIEYNLSCRKYAASILDHFEFYGDMYYALEDWLTLKLEGYKPQFPIGIDSEYLRCALRIEVKDYFDNNNAVAVMPEDIENVINELFKSFSQNVLNTDFIWNTVRDYIDKNNIKCEEEKENA